MLPVAQSRDVPLPQTDGSSAVTMPSAETPDLARIDDLAAAPPLLPAAQASTVLVPLTPEAAEPLGTEATGIPARARTLLTPSHAAPPLPGAVPSQAPAAAERPLPDKGGPTPFRPAGEDQPAAASTTLSSRQAAALTDTASPPAGAAENPSRPLGRETISAPPAAVVPSPSAPNTLSSAGAPAPTLAPAPAPALGGAAAPTAQLAQAIVSRGGPDTIEIRLDPPSLGRVQVSFDFTGDAPRAIIAAAQPDTLDQLRRGAPALMQELSDAGLGDTELSWSEEHLPSDDRMNDDERVLARAVRPDETSDVETLDAPAPRPARHDGGLDLTV